MHEPNPNKIEKLLESVFPFWSVSKKNEITRLIYEISKKENISFLEIIHNQEGKRFSVIKADLLKKRYPYGFYHEKDPQFYLPKIEINTEKKLVINNILLNPREIYVEEGIENNYLISRFKNLFPEAQFNHILSMKNYLKNKSFTIKDYNNRKNKFFIIKEKFDFVKKCPCTPDALPCGYNIFNIGFGCLFECTYCFLQGYQNFSGIIFPANIDDFFPHVISSVKNFSKGIFKYIRIGSGEFTDSLLFDEITGFSTKIINFFKQYPELVFEFKTKSTNIKNILKTPSAKNIVISWSLNPQKIINENEFYTSALKDRITAARECTEAGYSVSFHFDPIIYYDSWEKDYSDVINFVFDTIPEESILWFSLGTLRFTASFKRIIENRFPDNKIMNGELLLGYDNKLRYPRDMRLYIYEKMNYFIKKRSSKPIVYICMEDKDIWQKIGANLK